MVLPSSWDENASKETVGTKNCDVSVKSAKNVRPLSASVPPVVVGDIHTQWEESSSPRKRFHQSIENEENDNNNNNNSNSCASIKNNDGNNSIENNDSNVNHTDKINDNNTVVNNQNTLTVVKATEWHRHPIEDYKMTSRSRGICLIVNNVDFDLDLFAPRKGSDKDAFRFKEIFRQMGFDVDCKRNLTADKMKNVFKQKAALCMGKHDALIVILLSHGSETGIYGTDGIEVDMHDILSHFDNKKCKPMRNKPKVFIVQACRGRLVDYGVPDSQSFFSQPDSQSHAQPSQLTQSNSQTTKLPHFGVVDKEFCPTRADMVLCFSSHIGYVSNRNEENGSWLGTSLATHLVNQAHQKHLIEIFNMVSRDIRARRSSDGLKQVLEINIIGFDKFLYFNPGLTD